MSDEVSDLPDVPPRKLSPHWQHAPWVVAVFFGLIAGSTRRTLTGQDGIIWQVVMIAMIAMLLIMSGLAGVRALKARRDATL